VRQATPEQQEQHDDHHDQGKPTAIGTPAIVPRAIAIEASPPNSRNRITRRRIGLIELFSFPAERNLKTSRIFVAAPAVTAGYLRDVGPAHATRPQAEHASVGAIEIARPGWRAFGQGAAASEDIV
jgi:hypothetical protein